MAVEPISVPPALAAVITRAGDKSGVDFDYLVQTAMRESSLNPDAKASTSSATGLFQFIESTWLEVLKTDGPSLGYSEQARHIQRNSDGTFVVPNAAKRAEILEMRHNPQMSADLAAAFTRSNGEFLTEKFGRHPSPGELYIAHFLGAGGAQRMFEAGLSNPDQIAADIFPRQAEANRAIFFDREGAKTIREVYQSLVTKHTQSVAPMIDQSGTVISQNPVLPQTTGLQPAGPEMVQSRFGPSIPLDFATLYSNDVLPTTPVSTSDSAQLPSNQQGNRSVIIDPGAAFFTQLYSQ